MPITKQYLEQGYLNSLCDFFAAFEIIFTTFVAFYLRQFFSKDVTDVGGAVNIPYEKKRIDDDTMGSDH